MVTRSTNQATPAGDARFIPVMLPMNSGASGCQVLSALAAARSRAKSSMQSGTWFSLSM
jgi:hypothetical protein